MDVVFSRILNMSLNGSFVIAAVLLLRLALKKAPKKYSYFLWLVVFFRLLCPVTIESALSLIPVKADAVIYHWGTDGVSLEVDTGIAQMDALVVRGLTKAGEAVSAQPGNFLLGLLFSGAVIVWIVGMTALTAYGLAQLLQLWRKLQTAVLVEPGEGRNCPIYESEYIRNAFLFGIFKPRIYLPLGMGEERGYVIAHERIHLRRLDYIVKPVCYLAVIFHWFNPLVWLAFYLMTKDMEMSCDEQVLKTAIDDIRADYSRSLLKLSAKGSGLSVPLGFGESNTKARIRHALNYKNPSVWIGVAAAAVLLMAAVTLLTSGHFSDGGLKAGEKSMYEQLSENRSLYIGDASSNGRLIGLLPGLEGYEYDGMELQTDKEPYELKMRWKQTEGITPAQETENLKTMLINSALLFSTIENAGICTFQQTDLEGEASSVSIKKEELEYVLGSLYEKSQNAADLEELEKEAAELFEETKEWIGSLELRQVRGGGDKESLKEELLDKVNGGAAEEENSSFQQILEEYHIGIYRDSAYFSSFALKGLMEEISAFYRNGIVVNSGYAVFYDIWKGQRHNFS